MGGLSKRKGKREQVRVMGGWAVTAGVGDSRNVT